MWDKAPAEIVQRVKAEMAIHGWRPDRVCVDVRYIEEAKTAVLYVEDLDIHNHVDGSSTVEFFRSFEKRPTWKHMYRRYNRCVLSHKLLNEIAEELCQHIKE